MPSEAAGTRAPLSRARRLTESGAYGAAIHAWRQARNESPDSLDAHLGLADALERSGKPRDAETVILNAIDRFPMESRPVVAYAYLALHEMQWDEGFARFRALAERFPDRAAPFIGMSEALEGLGRLEEAHELAREAVRKFADPWAQIQTGRLAIKRGNVNDGLTEVAGALQRFEDQPSICIAAGEALSRLGCHDQAERILSNTMRRFPDSASVAVAYARAASAACDWDEAVKRWQAALHLDPELAIAEESLSEARREAANLDLPIVVIYGGCQADHIAKILNAALSTRDHFRFLPVLNHAPLGEKIPEIPAGAERATLYWEQYDERAEVPVREKLRALLPKDCERVTFAPTIFMGFWPFAWSDSRNKPEPGFPFGRYPWGDRVGQQLAKLDLEPERIVDEYLRISALEMPNVSNLISRDFDLQGRRDGASDVKIGDFVKKNLLSKYLFWTWGHPSAIVLGEIAQRLLTRSAGRLPGRPVLATDEIGEDLAGTGNEQLPLHPEVISRLGLRFRDANSEYNWMGQRWTFNEYICRYVTFDASW